MTYITTIFLSGAVSQRLCFFSSYIKASGAVIRLITFAFIPRLIFTLYEDWFLKPTVSLANPAAILGAFIHSLLFLEMLSKSFAALIIFILTSSTNAQAAITPLNSPALELKETPVSGEAQRASIADPCSNVNLAQNLDTSTSVTADETGAILLSPVNFNP